MWTFGELKLGDKFRFIQSAAIAYPVGKMIKTGKRTFREIREDGKPSMELTFGDWLDMEHVAVKKLY